MFSASLAAPVGQRERITILDSLRGMAILGILLMNIPSFGIAPWLSFDLRLHAEFGTINEYVFWFVEGVMAGTQRALFSMLFGAGILLFIGRQESEMEGLAPADYFFRRQVWLMVISCFDVYVLLWNGDILFDYACIGMVMFAFRKLSPRALLIAAVICLFFNVARDTVELQRDRTRIFKGEAIAQVDTTKFKLTEDQKEQLTDFQDMKKRGEVKQRLKRVEEANKKVRGSYAETYEWRTDHYIDGITNYLYLEAWDVFMFMFVGMAFYKLGVITGEASIRLYTWFTLAGLALGLTLAWFRISIYFEKQFEYISVAKSMSVELYQLERAFRSMGLFGLIMVMYKSGAFKWLFSMFRPVGQMALTNYLTQSILCGLYFNGFGLGMYGYLERYQLYYVVIVIWIFQIIFCHIWMRYFLYGPFEWLWRSLTYWYAQPFRKR
jgi:uncharacterized protein